MEKDIRLTQNLGYVKQTEEISKKIIEEVKRVEKTISQKDNRGIFSDATKERFGVKATKDEDEKAVER